MCLISKPVTITSFPSKKVCKECFFIYFEETIHNTITSSNMFKKNETVIIGMSGGKDSTVLAYVLNKLNKEKGYKLNLHLLAIDEGISGYRDHSLKMVYYNQRELNLPLKVISYKDLYNVTLDEVVIKTGRLNTCSKCGTFRRHALEMGAMELNGTALVTGHNSDDIAETVLLNFFRGDIHKLKSCTQSRSNGKIARCKPFKYTYQKDIVMYALYKDLKYFSTECVYFPGAYRGNMRMFLKKLERIDKSLILNIIKTGDYFYEESSLKLKECKKCKITSKNEFCQACTLSDLINKIN